MPAPAPSSFAAAWSVAQHIPGWLTQGQARLLWDSATGLPEHATVVEIGSHQGRSTVVLGTAVREGGGTVVAVDPFVEGPLFGGAPTRTKFESNIERAGLDGTVELLPEFSTKARRSWSRAFQLLYIDGKHDYWTLSDDLRWTRHLPQGAPVLVHDCFSSIGVTLGVLVHVLFSRHLRYERRTGSLALFRVHRPSAADRLRLLAQLPWWVRNVVVKVLLRLRLRSVAARVFGHASRYDPY